LYKPGWLLGDVRRARLLLSKRLCYKPDFFLPEQISQNAERKNDKWARLEIHKKIASKPPPPIDESPLNWINADPRAKISDGGGQHTIFRPDSGKRRSSRSASHGLTRATN